MSAAPIACRRETPLIDILECTRYECHRIYPIVDERHRLGGQLTGERVAEALRTQRVDVTAGDLMEPTLIAARTDETVHALLGRMHATRVDRCPVVDDGGVVVGFVRPSDFVRARFHRQAEPGDETLR